MIAFLKNIISESLIKILVYAGRCLVDKCIGCWHERKKKKEARPADETGPADHTAEKPDKTITPVPMEEILERNKEQRGKSPKRKLFAEGELHVICAQTGMGKSILSVQMGLATAGGEDSEPYTMVKSILGDNWDTTRQRVEYIDGENGEEELCGRYGKARMNYPDTFTVVPAGEISSIDELEEHIRQCAKENKPQRNYTIIIDHPGCYKGNNNHQRMRDFYKALKNIILDYRSEGYRLTIFVIGFLDTAPWKPVTPDDIKGTKELGEVAHTIVALCPCRLGKNYRFLKVLKSRSWDSGEEVFVLEKSTANGLFFRFVRKMKEEEALPLRLRKQTGPVASSSSGVNDMPETGGLSVVPTAQEVPGEENGTARRVTVSGRKRQKVTEDILLQIQELADEGMKQQDIADMLNLCRKTVNKYLQKIQRGECALSLSPC